MNVLPVAGPESTTLFTVTVQHSGRPQARRVGPVSITVPLNRLQGTLRRLRLDGKILSVTRCPPVGGGDPSPPTLPVPEPEPAPVASATETAEGPDAKEVLTRSLVDLAVESWRFAWRFGRLLQKLAAGEDSRRRGQLSAFRQKLNGALRDAGMGIENMEGHPFGPDVKATPLNREDFGTEDGLVVDRMAEPIVTAQNGVVLHRGTVMLKAAEPPSATTPAEETAGPTPTEPLPETAEGSHPNREVLAKALVDLAVEGWRFGKLFGQLLEKLVTGERSRYRGQLSWFEEKLNEALKEAGMKIANVEGHPFDPGVAATPLNAGDFAADDALVIDRMLEPVIMGSEGIVRMGTVTLKKVEA